MPATGGAPKLLGADRIPADFPTDALVVPRKVVFRSPDGLTIHGQLFEQPNLTGKHPAVVFVHGGPPRQMLLGWHYSEYYSNAYADEPVPGEPRLRRAVGQLPPRHRLRARLPPSAARGTGGRRGVPGRARRRPLPGGAAGGGCAPGRDLGRLVRRVPHGDGAGEELGRVLRRLRPARRARLDGGPVREVHDVALREGRSRLGARSGVALVAGGVRAHLEVAGAS